MSETTRIRIAAALVGDTGGRVLLVRKRNTRFFMQPGGKIELGESALAALGRELREEIGVTLEEGGARYLGSFEAEAANEPGATVEAALFHIELTAPPVIGSEIEEAIWVTLDAAERLLLAPLTRDHVLRLARTL